MLFSILISSKSPFLFLRPYNAIIILIEPEFCRSLALPANASLIFFDAPVFSDCREAEPNFLCTRIPCRTCFADTESLNLYSGSLYFFGTHFPVVHFSFPFSPVLSFDPLPFQRSFFFPVSYLFSDVPPFFQRPILFLMFYSFSNVLFYYD